MIIGGVSKQLLHDFIRSLGSKDCHIALLTKEADYNAMSETFSGQGEIKATGYASGGKKLQGFVHGLDNGVAWCAWNNADWMNASIKAHGAVIYAKGDSNRVVTVLDFGAEHSSSQGLFRVKLPLPGAKDAIFWLT